MCPLQWEFPDLPSSPFTSAVQKHPAETLPRASQGSAGVDQVQVQTLTISSFVHFDKENPGQVFQLVLP